MAQSPFVVAIVPTRSRPAQLRNALESIRRQKRPPDLVLVVGEALEDLRLGEETDEPIGSAPGFEVGLLLNRRTANLSGAVNTALGEILRRGHFPSQTFVALLDDDDYWDSNYVERCLGAAERDSLDWVIAGIIRHESETDPCTAQGVPTGLDISDFLMTNPGIQGSNLFLRLSTLLRAGGFDEALQSTTDRDLCIRLLDLGDVRYGVIDAQLVHHNAYAGGRLSTPGSPAKTAGLNAFYRKHGPRMTEDQRRAFKARAAGVFSVEIQKISETTPTVARPPAPPPLPQNDGSLELLVGFTASSPVAAARLAGDLATLSVTFPGVIRLVVCSHTPEEGALGDALRSSLKEGSTFRLIGTDEIQKACDAGTLGTFYEPKGRRTGIAFGRTVLHHYLYEEALALSDPAVWILDDDVRLDSATVGDPPRPLEGVSLAEALLTWRGEGVSVVIGQIVGDPPLPALRTVRGQLVDLFHMLASFEGEGGGALMAQWRSQRYHPAYADYHYDLSLQRFDHLEHPFLARPHEDAQDQAGTLERLLQDASHIADGRAPFRPAMRVPTSLDARDEVPTRGGNTIVLDLECLRRYPNLAPFVGNLALRRGDTLWAVLNSRLGGKQIGRERKAVKLRPFAVTQDRPVHNDKALNIDALEADILGAAFTAAVENELNRAEVSKGSPLAPGDLRALPVDSGCLLLKEMRALVEERLLLFEMNAWRVRGLVASIRGILKRLPDVRPELAPVIEKRRGGLLSALARIEAAFSIEGVAALKHCLTGPWDGEIAAFLKDWDGASESYRKGSPPHAWGRQIQEARAFIASQFGAENLRLVGQGSEGVVFTDGRKAYKHFHNGERTFLAGKLECLKKVLGPGAGPKIVHPIEEALVEGGRCVILTPFAEGEPYSGGHLSDILELCRECRRLGVVLMNTSLSNLIVTPEGVRFVDIGAGIEPFDERKYEEMCRRLYLAFRWPFRADLPELMRRSLADQGMPELFGVEHFLNAINVRFPVELYRDPVVDAVEKLGGHVILDYGVGNGAIAARLAQRGYKVDAFDIDGRAFVEGRHKAPGIRLIDREQLDSAIASGKRYEVVVCNRVLCEIGDEASVERVVGELRQLVTDDGHVVLGVCNPFDISTRETESCIKELPPGAKYGDRLSYRKNIKKNATTRVDHHRPYSWLKRILLRAGLEVQVAHETPATDIDVLAPGSEVLLLTLRPLPPVRPADVTLLIKASPQEWCTIEFQVKHIMGQLEGPQRFVQRIVVADTFLGPYARQYAEPDLDKFRAALARLVEEGVIDRVVWAPDPDEAIRGINRRWFGLDSAARRSANGQPTVATLAGFDACRTEFVLQVDSDCLILRRDRGHDYLREIVRAFRENPDAVTVSLPIAGDAQRPCAKSSPAKKWRTEVRCSVVALRRLERMLPLPNSQTAEGLLELPWHRSLDRSLAAGRHDSLRCIDDRTFFIHVSNERKGEPNAWFNIARAIEDGRFFEGQVEKVDLVGSVADWLGKRDEEMVILVRGRNVNASRLRRCFDSIERQRYGSWSVVAIEAASENEMGEWIDLIARSRLGSRLTVYCNLEPVPPIANIDFAIRNLCANPNSIIVQVDADDALIGDDALDEIVRAYQRGADVTVGTMLRTDKHREYPVEFERPRERRGGNVWQSCRTFRKYLYDWTSREGMKVDGEWIPHTEDWAIMVPVVELSKRPIQIERPIYFYEASPQKRKIDISEREALIARILGSKRSNEKRSDHAEVAKA